MHCIVQDVRIQNVLFYDNQENEFMFLGACWWKKPVDKGLPRQLIDRQQIPVIDSNDWLAVLISLFRCSFVNYMGCLSALLFPQPVVQVY